MKFRSAIPFYGLLLFFLLAQEAVSFRAAAQYPTILHYTVADGLPSSIVYRCAQDHRGFMWFGTESGISRFDGKDFRNFSIPDGLTETEILDIFCAANGDLWLLPFGGSPMRFDPVTGVCHTANTDPELRKIVYKGILNITQLKNGDILFSYSNNSGLYRYTNGKISEVSLPVDNNSNIKSIHELNNGLLLINIPKANLLMNTKTGAATRAGNIQGEVVAMAGDSLFSFNSATGYLYSSLYTPGADAITIDSTFAGTGAKKTNGWGQLLYFCNNHGGIDIYNHSLKKINSLFTHELFNTTFVDRDGNLWLCSYTRGVYSLPVSRMQLFNSNNGLTDDYVCSVLPLPGGHVLAGFSNGSIQSVNTLSGNTASLFTLDSGALTNRVRKIIQMKKGGVIAVSDQSLIYSDDSSPVHFNSWSPYGKGGLGGKDICEFRDGEFLLPNTNSLLTLNISTKKLDTLFRGRTTCVEAGYNNDAWFSTVNGVYYVKDIRTGLFEYMGEADTLLTKRMNSIAAGNDGLVWMASANTGIIVLQNNRVIAQVTAAGGLASDLCRNVFLEKGSRRAWVATNNGISRVSYQLTDNKLTWSIQNYNTSYGLPDNDINKVALQEGIVYAATASGLVVFRPVETKPDIPVHIVEVTVEGRKMKVDNSFSLEYFQNDISISFTGICFTCAGRLQYQYRMLSPANDTAWITTGSQQVNFSAMRPGRYTFQVKTASGNRITSLSFLIRRPWYAQWWFWAICIGAIAGSVIIIYRNRVKNIENKSAQAQQMARLEMQALQAQMNPHFIFNSLNSISHFISENDSTRAQNYLGSFSRLMRLFLESTRSKYISIAQEKELLLLYLQLEQLRFSNRFTYAVEIDPLLNTGYEIPSMLLQPFVENAVNHGLYSKPGRDGHIAVRFYKEENKLCCTIDDNGIGRAAAASMRTAKGHISRSMQITEERLKTLEQSTGTRTHILVEDKYDEAGQAAGTRITIRISEQEETD